MKYVINQRCKEDEGFEIIEFDIVPSENDGVFRKRNMRAYITIVILILLLVFLIGAAIYGLMSGDFIYLRDVSSYIQAPMGVIIGYYFGSNETK